jgi:LysM repeat protein
MKFRIFIVASIAIFFILLLSASPRATRISAAPQMQATPAPTEEPTKRPYVFPTPVFIPTYADDTPVPRRNTPSVTLIPGEQTYTVESGDSPWIIAQKVYGDGTKYRLIMEANGITDQTRLRVGTVLRIPTIDGNPAPVPVQPTTTPSAPTSAPILAQPTMILPTAVPVPTLLPTPIPTPASNTLRDNLPTLISIASAILLIAGIIAGVLAYLMFLRARRLAQLAATKQPIRIKQ